MEEFIHQVTKNYYELVLLWPQTLPPHPTCEMKGE